MRGFHARLGVLAVLFLFGVVLLGGSGLTGMVISESCCAGDSCAPENRCTSMLQNPAVVDSGAASSGVLIVFVTAALGVGELMRERGRREPKREWKPIRAV